MKKLLSLTAFALLLGGSTSAAIKSEPHSLIVPGVPAPRLSAIEHRELAIVPGQSSLESSDQRIFQQLIDRAIAQNWQAQSLGDIIQAISEQFLATPYTEGLLDRTPNEALSTSLQEFDCVLFVETVLAIARGIVVKDYLPRTFTTHLQQQRYRNGEINGYCSRLHYFSDWIAENQRQNIVTDITKEFGGVSLGKTLNFMSENRGKYPKLVASEKEYQCVQQIEAQLNSTLVNYIPTQQIRSRYAELKSGDILAIATRVPGLDVTHTGFVYRSANGEVGIIHAAPGRGVKISPDLQTYLTRVDDAIGVIVARPIENRLSIP